MSLRDPVGRAFVVLVLITLAPVWLTAELPLLDLPNHLARAEIYLHLSELPFSSYFAWAWTPVPNLAAELPLIGLVALLGPAVGAKALVTLILVLLGFGALCLHFVLFGRLSVAPLFVIPFLLNGVLQHGFLSYMLGIALALFVIALWLGGVGGRSQRRAWLIAACVFALFYAHLYAFAVFFWFAIVYLAVVFWRDRDPASLRHETLLLACYAALPLLTFVLLSPTAGSGSAWSYTSLAAGFFLKIGFFWIFFGSASAMVGVILLSLAVFELWRWARRTGARVQPFGVMFLITGFGLYALLPFTAFSSNNADWRLLLPLTLIGFACVVAPPPSSSPDRSSSPGRSSFWQPVALLAVLAIVRAGATYSEWSRSAQVFDDYREVTAGMPQRAKLFVAALGVPRNSLILPVPVWHVGAISVIEKRAFVQRLFANPRQQPLRYRGEAEDLRRGIERIHYRPGEQPDWKEVVAGYDYILLLRPGGLGTDLPEPFPLICTMLAGRTRGFVFYRIVHETKSCRGERETQIDAGPADA